MRASQFMTHTGKFGNSDVFRYKIRKDTIPRSDCLSVHATRGCITGEDVSQKGTRQWLLTIATNRFGQSRWIYEGILILISESTLERSNLACRMISL